MNSTSYRVEYLDGSVWKLWSAYRYLGTARNRVQELDRPARVIEVHRSLV